jgi:hypothetical protein
MYLIWTLFVTADFSGWITDFDCVLFRSRNLDTPNLNTDILIWNGTHGGCDRSAGDAHSGTWSYLRICRRSLLPYTRFCNCLLDYDCVLHIVNFAILYLKRNFSHINNPVRIRVRIDPPHPLVCRKRRLNLVVLQMRPEKPRFRVTAGVAR